MSDAKHHRSHNPRTNPPFWRHDWYTLLRLSQAIKKTVHRQLHSLPPGPIIDMGAGSAPYKSLFAPLKRDYLACDIDDNAQIKITPGEPAPLDSQSAAAVVSFQVLEHVWDLDWYLGECRRLLQDDGCLVLSTHGVWLYHPHPTDYRRWTIDGLRQELETRNFQVINIIPVVGPLAWTLQFRAIGYHQAFCRLPVVGEAISAVVCSLLNAKMVVEDMLTPREIKAKNSAVYVMIAKPRKDGVA